MTDAGTDLVPPSPSPSPTPNLPARVVDEATVRRAVDAGIAAYFADRRTRIQPFVDRHFSSRGALRLHRRALGWDILKAPANLALAVPQTALKAAGAAAGRFGATALARRLNERNLLLKTAVAQEIEWLIVTEFLELPHRQGERRSSRDALAESILSQPAILEAATEALVALAPNSDNEAFRRQLDEAVATYTGSRGAAAEITTSLFSLAAGATLARQLTPGALSLGPSLAAALANKAAIGAFPLGASLGNIWYGLFPAAAPSLLTVGLTGGIVAVVAIASAFAGIVADPVQRRLGLHQRRLGRLLDALERQMRDPAAPGFAARDHYVARVMDLFDVIGFALRLARH